MKKIIIDNIETDYEINELGEIYSYKTNKILSGSILNNEWYNDYRRNSTYKRRV